MLTVMEDAVLVCVYMAVILACDIHRDAVTAHLQQMPVRQCVQLIRVGFVAALTGVMPGFRYCCMPGCLCKCNTHRHLRVFVCQTGQNQL
jgi:hypothetical protein